MGLLTQRHQFDANDNPGLSLLHLCACETETKRALAERLVEEREIENVLVRKEIDRKKDR